MKKLTAIITLILIPVFIVFSQDTLMMMNGKFIQGDVTKIEDGFVHYQFNKGDKLKLKKVEIEDLFSIQYNNSDMYIFYKQDSSLGYYYTQEEMYSFVLGENYARKYFKAPLSTAGGFLTGVTGGMVGFWGFTIPTAYTIINGSNNPHFVTDKPLPVKTNTEYLVTFSEVSEKSGYSMKPTTETKEELPLLQDIQFYEGYNVAAKDKKVKNALKGGLIGFASLVAASYILLSIN